MNEDFLYGKWLEKPVLNPKISKMPDNEGLHESANAFLGNMGRVEALARLPYLLVSLGITKGHADLFAKTEGKPAKSKRFLAAEPKLTEAIAKDAVHLAGQAANSTVPIVRTAHQALVAAIIIISYGTLENLMVDLRAAAEKIRPEILKCVSKSLLTRRNLSDLRKTYEQMFPEDAKRSPHNLSKEFASHYQALLVLEAVRNLFAHRSGIVDQRFLKRVETSSALSKLKVGQELFVNFEIARALAGVARDFGVYLIRFVDWWLNTHATA